MAVKVDLQTVSGAILLFYAVGLFIYLEAIFSLPTDSFIMCLR